MQQLLFGGLIGVVAGFLAGRVTERARRARADYRTGKKAVPTLQKAFFTNLEKALRIWVVVGIAIAAILLAWFNSPE